MFKIYFNNIYLVINTFLRYLSSNLYDKISFYFESESFVL